MRKIGIMAALVIATFLLPAWVFASEEPLMGGFSNDYLQFKLSHDTAMIMNTTGDTVNEIAVDTLYIQFNDPMYLSDSIASFKAELIFDTTVLQFRSAAPLNWGGAFDSSLTAVGTSKRLLLEFWGARTQAQTWTPFAVVRFKPKCQAEGTVDLVNFYTAGSNEINLIPSGEQYKPCDTCYFGGSVTVGDYYSTFSLRHDTLANAVGASYFMPVRANTNFRTQSMHHWFTYDEDVLEMDSVQALHAFAVPPTFDESRPDTVVVYAYPNGGPWSVYTDTVIYRMWFTVKCGAPHRNYLTPISWVTDSVYIGGPVNCSYTGVVHTFFDGSLKQLDYAAYAADTATARPGMTLTTFQYPIKMVNTFDAGIPSRPETDTGIIVNIDPGSPYVHLTSVTATGPSPLSFTTAGEGNLIQVKQQDSGNLVRSVSTTPVPLFNLNLFWNPDTYTPSWASRIIQPTFISSIGANHPAARVPGSAACIRAIPNATGDIVPLNFGTIPPLIVKMAEFATVGLSSTSACTYFDLKVRGTCPVSDFKMKITVPTSFCINGMVNAITGVVDSCVNPQTIMVYSTPAFNTIAASDGYTTLARINVGLNHASCPYKRTYPGFAPIITEDTVWSAPGQREYLVKAIGGASAKCTPPGSNCCSPCSDYIDRQEDPVGGISKPDNGLPREFALDQNYPNPFNPTTTISLDLPKASDWTITVFNITGQVIKTYSGNSGPGRVQVEFDGSQVASGVYLYRAEAGEFRATKKMVLMK